MAELAINGGNKVRTEYFPSYDVIGKEEEIAVQKVLQSGVLSKYLGCWDDDFYGGPQVRALEDEWANYFGVKHAIAINSATSGLYAAVGALGLEPGDEVIVSPYTMSASATAPLIYNAIPVFADIEPETFCLDPQSVEEKITNRTKAIIVVNIFGQPYDMERINAIAKKHRLMIIEDNAQAPGAMYKDKMAGTLGDVGVFSLNYHKHIHCGEGGIAVTDNDELADRIRLIRNHAEAVVGDKGNDNIINLIGFNLRMTEIEAAIAREQLKKLKQLVDKRIENVNYMKSLFEDFQGIDIPKVREWAKHVYYVFPMLYNVEEMEIPREKYIEAVRAELMPMRRREAEGVGISCGYTKPLYKQPLFVNRIAYGNDHYPFNLSDISYEGTVCPVCEDLYYNTLVMHELMHANFEKKDLEDVFRAFEKVYKYRDELR